MTETNINHSKFYMLRCIIAVAHEDGVVCDEERAYMSAIMNRLPLSHEQRAQLLEDFNKKQDIADLFRQINDPSYRSQVLYFARIMAHKDGIVTPSEDALLERLYAMTTDGIDLDAIRKEAKAAVQEQLLLHDAQMADNRPTRNGHVIPYFQWLDEILLRLSIDLLQ